MKSLTLLIAVLSELLIVSKLAVIQYPSVIEFYSNWENLFWVFFLVSNSFIIFVVLKKV